MISPNRKSHHVQDDWSRLLSVQESLVTAFEACSFSPRRPPVWFRWSRPCPVIDWHALWRRDFLQRLQNATEILKSPKAGRFKLKTIYFHVFNSHIFFNVVCCWCFVQYKTLYLISQVYLAIDSQNLKRSLKAKYNFLSVWAEFCNFYNFTLLLFVRGFQYSFWYVVPVFHVLSSKISVFWSRNCFVCAQTGLNIWFWHTDSVF